MIAPFVPMAQKIPPKGAADVPLGPGADVPGAGSFLSDEPTLELVVRAQGGDRVAVEALLQRCLPSVKRWAHGRLPAVARGSLDTEDLVQESAMHVLRRLDVFEPRHVGAMQAYLRQSVVNRIRDEVRRIGRQPPPVELPEDLPGDRTSPLELAIQSEAYERYRRALTTLTTIINNTNSHSHRTNIRPNFPILCLISNAL